MDIVRGNDDGEHPHMYPARTAGEDPAGEVP